MVGKGAQSNHGRSRKDSMSQYNFLSLGHHLRGGGWRLTGRRRTEFEGWGVRKCREAMMDPLQSNDMKDEKLRESSYRLLKV